MPTGLKIDVVEFIKLSPKYFLPFLLFSGAFIFLPINWLEFLSLESIANKYKWIFSLVFILSASLIISGIAFKLYEEIRKKTNLKKNEKSVKEKLQNLSEYQKEIVTQLFHGGNRSINLPLNNGEVRELELYNIIYRSTNLSSRFYNFDYILQPIAEDVLKKNKGLLK